MLAIDHKDASCRFRSNKRMIRDKLWPRSDHLHQVAHMPSVDPPAPRLNSGRCLETFHAHAALHPFVLSAHSLNRSSYFLLKPGKPLTVAPEISRFVKVILDPEAVGYVRPWNYVQLVRLSNQASIKSPDTQWKVDVEEPFRFATLAVRRSDGTWLPHYPCPPSTPATPELQPDTWCLKQFSPSGFAAQTITLIFSNLRAGAYFDLIFDLLGDEPSTCAIVSATVEPLGNKWSLREPPGITSRLQLQEGGCQ